MASALCANLGSTRSVVLSVARRFTSPGKQYRALPSDGTRGEVKLGVDHKAAKKVAFSVFVSDCGASDGNSLDCDVVQGFRYLLRIHGGSR